MGLDPGPVGSLPAAALRMLALNPGYLTMYLCFLKLTLVPRRLGTCLRSLMLVAS